MISQGIEGSLIPYGVSMISPPRTQCTKNSRSELSKLLVHKENHIQISHAFLQLAQIDQANHRRIYYLRLLNILKKYPPLSYNKVVIAYLEESLEQMYRNSETISHALLLRKAFPNVSRL